MSFKFSFYEYFAYELGTLDMIDIVLYLVASFHILPARSLLNVWVLQSIPITHISLLLQNSASVKKDYSPSQKNIPALRVVLNGLACSSIFFPNISLLSESLPPLPISCSVYFLTFTNHVFNSTFGTGNDTATLVVFSTERSYNRASQRVLQHKFL